MEHEYARSMTMRCLLVVLALVISVAVPSATAHGGSPGQLLWQDRLPGFVFPSDVAVEGDHVVVVGTISDAPFNTTCRCFPTDFLVRVYQAETGDLLWQDRVDNGFADAARAVIIDGGMVFVGGRTLHAHALPGPNSNSDVFVRAYDLGRGTLVWQDQFDRAGHFDEVFLRNIAVDQGRLFVGGRSQSANGDSDFFVRAYDARTGTFLWQDFFDGGGGLFDVAYSVAADEGRVFGAGSTTDAARIQHFTVRAYDGATGGLLWMDQQATGAANASLRGTDTAQKIVAQGGRVVAAGAITNAAGTRSQFAVRAYDAGTGAVLWSDLLDTGGGADVAQWVALAGSRVVAAGFGGAGCNFNELVTNCDWLVRAYDVGNGTLLWSKQRDQSGTDDSAEFVVVQGNRVIVSGVAHFRLNAAGRFEQDWLVQAYDAQNGDLVWEDRLSQSNMDIVPNAGLVVQGDRVFAAGNASSNITGGTDWLVRAYELH